MPDCDINNVNVKAFLKLLRYAENVPRDDDQLYYRLFGGGMFTDISKHPNKRITIGNYTSTAAGAYQILYSTWFKAKQDGIAFDFSPASQDAVAFSKLKSRVSLPGGSQSRMSLQAASQRFQTYVSEFSK